MILEKRTTLRSIAVLIIVFFIAQASLFSQEKSEEAESKADKLFKMSLEELMNVKISTAGKTPERIGDIPASVVLITREDIEAYGYSTLTEILESIPGLYSLDDYSEGGANFGVRGFWSGVANDNMIIMVNYISQVNDFESNYPLNKINIPVEAIDRIEVIRGPMSVVYGNGAFYGVINIITNDNTYGPLSMIEGGIGTADTKKLFARVAGSEGDFNYVFNSSVYDTYGLDEPLINMTKNPSILSSLGVPLDSRTGGRLENNERYFNFSGLFKGFSVNVIYTEGKREFYFAFPSVDEGSYINKMSAQISVGYKKELSNSVSIEGKFNYSKSRNSYQYDHLFKGFYGIQEIDTNAWEGEFNIFISPWNNLDIAGGLYYRSVFDASNKYDLPSFGVPALENNYIFLVDGDCIVTQALFTQINYAPFDSLRLVAGVRLEQSPKYGLRKIQTVGDEPPVKLDAIYDRDEVEIIPRFAALYYLNDRNIFKLLYGRAINRPSFAQNYLNSLLAQRKELEPESIQTFELNYISTISSRYTLNISLFRNVLNKLITRVVQFDDQGNYASWSDNAGKMVTHGVELTLNTEPLDNFRIELSGTFQKTEDKRDLYENITKAYSPKLLGYLKASYHTEWFTLAVTGNYVGAMETFWDETKTTPINSVLPGNRLGDRVNGYFVLGANLRLRYLFIYGLFLNIRCSNLLDEEIRYPTFTNNDWADRGTIGSGRTFLVTLGYKF
ncbi:MAG: TonB-dependent receptor [Candidatus Aminicenantes bacterium]|nr:MAG: TonB-dependent receptor [Candidatus Aminicenantes bacterium]